MTVHGIDVSAHNGTYALAGLDFVFVRASYGTQKDSRFDDHFGRAVGAGVVTGAYCFGRNMNGGLQADRLMQIAPDADFLFLDRERDGNNPTMTTAQARAFVKRVHDKGRKVGFYASESGYPKDAFGADFRWVANYSRQPKIRWDWWQYTGTGLDRSYFHGTKDELLELADRPEPEPVPTGDPMTNLVPLTVHRVVDLPAGTELEKTPGGALYTRISNPVTLGLLGATGTHYHVADGDAGVYVARTGITPRTADLNGGA